MRRRPGPANLVSRIAVLACVLLAMLPLAGCPRPGTVSAASASTGAIVLRGHVDLAAFALGRQSYHAAAAMGEVANLATVSVIDTSTSRTAASTVTDGGGNFSLSFGGFSPDPAHSYYLEAVKGLFGNQAGKNDARVRTIVAFQNGGWVSLTNAIPNVGIQIDRSTTALSIIVGLRALTANKVTAGSLLSKVLPAQAEVLPGYPTTDDTFGAATTAITGVSAPEFHQVWGFVTDVLSHNQDPVGGVLINTTANAAAPWYTYYESLNGFSVNTLTPASGPVGTLVTVGGQNFDPTLANNQVRFNGVLAPVISESADQTQLVVRVPSGATSGPLSLQVGATAGTGPAFTVTSNDGHTLFDGSGNFYVAGSNGAIYRMAPGGALSLLSSGFNSPRSLCLDAAGANLYVADAGTGIVSKVTLSTGASASFATGLSTPWGLTFDPSGNLYVSNQGNGTISRVSPAGAVSTLVTGLSSPAGLGFDPNTATLYVADAGSNAVKAYAGGTLTTLAAGFYRPLGLAVDTAGNVYVANNKGSEVFRITPAGAVSTVAARFTGPTSLVFDSAGNLYVSTYDNNVFEIARTGSQTRQATGFTSPWGLAYDASGNLIAVGNGDNTVSRASGPNAPAQAFAGVSAGNGVATDSAGNLYVAATGNTLYKVTSAGAASPLVIGSEGFNGVALDASGNLYATEQTTLAIAKYGPTGTSLGTFAWSPGGETSAIASDSLGNQYYCVSVGRYSVSQGWQTVGSLVKYSAGTTTAVASGVPGSVRGVAVDGSNNVYYSSEWEGRVYKLAGGVTTVFASGFSSPRGIKFDGAGNLYVANAGNGSISKVSPTGVVTNGWATGMGELWGLTIDPWGNLYVAGYGSSIIYKVFNNGTSGTVTTYATQNVVNPLSIAFDPGQNLYVGQSWGQANILRIATGSTTPAVYLTGIWGGGVLPDAAGNVYACDWNGFKRFDTNKSATMLQDGWGNPVGAAMDRAGNLWIAGTWGYVHEVNAAGADQLYNYNFCDLRGITTDAAGNAYVADGCGRIFKLTAGATQSATTIAGGGLNDPTGITLDPSGTSLLVAERGSHDVKRVALSNGAITPTLFWPYNPTF